MSDETKRSRTLLVAFVFPDQFDDDVDIDADIVADCIRDAINEDRQRNAEEAGQPDYYQPVEISAIPAPQWVTTESLQHLRAAAGAVPEGDEK